MKSNPFLKETLSIFIEKIRAVLSEIKWRNGFITEDVTALEHQLDYIQSQLHQEQLRQQGFRELNKYITLAPTVVALFLAGYVFSLSEKLASGKERLKISQSESYGILAMEDTLFDLTKDYNNEVSHFLREYRYNINNALLKTDKELFQKIRTEYVRLDSLYYAQRSYARKLERIKRAKESAAKID